MDVVEEEYIKYWFTIHRTKDIFDVFIVERIVFSKDESGQGWGNDIFDADYIKTFKHVLKTLSTAIKVEAIIRYFKGLKSEVESGIDSKIIKLRIKEKRKIAKRLSRRNNFLLALADLKVSENYDDYIWLNNFFYEDYIRLQKATPRQIHRWLNYRKNSFIEAWIEFEIANILENQLHKNKEYSATKHIIEIEDNFDIDYSEVDDDKEEAEVAENFVEDIENFEKTQKLKGKVSNGLKFLTKKCHRFREIPVSSLEYQKIIEWVVLYFQNDLEVPEINEPITEIKTTQQSVIINFKTLFKEISPGSFDNSYLELLKAIFPSMFKDFTFENFLKRGGKKFAI